MKGGQAIAEIMLGKVEPSGRLPITFPRHVGQLPVYYNLVRGQHGRRYADLTQEPAYAFGEGLSYTTTEFTNAAITGVKSNVFTLDDTVDVGVTVTNTGSRPCLETVQVYIRDLVTSVTWADKELKGFAHVDLAPGESKDVHVEIPVKECTIVDAHERRIVEPGEFEALVGKSSKDSDLIPLRFVVVQKK
jgi:beta-glucosidase